MNGSPDIGNAYSARNAAAAKPAVIQTSFLTAAAYDILPFSCSPPMIWKCRWSTVCVASGPTFDTMR